VANQTDEEDTMLKEVIYEILNASAALSVLALVLILCLAMA